MIRLIISDIDGTLIDHDGALPAANVAALAEASARGVRIVLATVRKRDSTERIAQQLGIACTLVCEGGALIYDSAGRTQYRLTIPLDLARVIATLAEQHSMPLITTIDGLNYCTPNARIAGHTSAQNIEVASILHVLDRPPSRLIVRGAAGIELLMHTFAAAPLRFVRHYDRAGTLYDAAITHADASKAAALELLCQQWQIGPADVLALGDSESDIGMLRLAGVGVAMGDAHASVRAAADWIAPAAGAAGLAAALRRFAEGSA